MKINVVLVEPIYQVNIGYIARICANFGVDSLSIVNPKCKYNGKNAVKYSKHGISVLNNAKVYGTIEEATKGSFAIGSTAIWRKASSSLYNIYSLSDVSAMLEGRERISIVLGRESTGLTKEELGKFPANIFIPLQSDYKILNISHALAVILYEVSKKGIGKEMHRVYADERDIENTLLLFRKLVERKQYIRNKKVVYASLMHILNRARPTKKELSALAVALAEKEKDK